MNCTCYLATPTIDMGRFHTFVIVSWSAKTYGRAKEGLQTFLKDDDRGIPYRWVLPYIKERGLP